MQRLRTSLALAGALSASLLFLSGCQNQGSEPGPSASASPTSTAFTGQALPSKVDRLSGTPLYTISPELAAKAKLDGAPFLIIAPQDPSQALLIVEAGSQPAELVKRPSKLTDFSGATESIDAPELIGLVKDKTGLNLKTDASGKVVALKVASSTTPAPGATP